MPIAARLRKQFYGKTWRDVIRPRILQRARNKCEQCGKPNHARVFTYTWREPAGPRMIWIREGSRVWRNQWGRAISLIRPQGLPRKILIDLQICHLNNCPGDDRDRDDNLRFCAQLRDASPFGPVGAERNKYARLRFHFSRDRLS